MSNDQMERNIESIGEEDLFGLDAEFATAYGHPEPDQTAQEMEGSGSSLLEQEFDFGSGPVKIQGTSEKDIYNKAIEAQKRFYEEKVLLDTSDDDDIPIPMSYEPIPPPTPDDVAALLLQWPQDPVEAAAKSLEYATGIPRARLQEIDERIREAENRTYGHEVGNKFLKKHLKFDNEGFVVGGDYYPTPENADKIARYLIKHEMEPTLKNWEAAFREVKNFLVPFPEDYSNDTLSEESTAPTGLGGDLSDSRGSAGLSAEEAVRQIETMSPKELDAWANARRAYR